MFSQTILIITVSGTARIMPKNPQIYPQRERLTRIANGESPRFFPSMRGSMIFPSVRLIAVRKNKMKIGFANEGENCRRAKIVVIPTEIIEPNTGMKFIINAMKAHTIGKSMPVSQVARKTKSPVASEM